MNKRFLGRRAGGGSRSDSVSRWCCAALLIAALCVGCRSLPYFVHVGGEPAEKAAPPAEQLGLDGPRTSHLAVGHELYVSRCTHCHGAMPISDYAADDWTARIIPKMAPKAKMNADETKFLTDYVLAVRTTMPPK